MTILSFILLISMSIMTGLSQTFLKKWREDIAAGLSNKKLLMLIDLKVWLIGGLILLASLFYLYTLNTLKLSVAFSFTGLNYLTTLFFSWWILKEDVKLGNILGSLLIAVGIIVFNL